MKKHFINYAARGFKQSQELSIDIMKNWGFNTKAYGEADIDDYYFRKNKKHFDESRGAGYWVWKPYIIQNALENIDEGDYLIYMDSGCKFIKDPTPLFDLVDEKGFLTFYLSWLNSTWTKGDIFQYISPSENYLYSDKPMVLSGYIIMKKCRNVETIISLWRGLVQDFHLVSDEPSIIPNLPDFIESRHDQSLFSLLVYKYGLKTIPQIDQYRWSHNLYDDFIWVECHGVRT